MRKKVLITGGTGLLGLALLKSGSGGFEIYAGYYNLNFSKDSLPVLGPRKYVLFDIKKKDEVKRVLDEVRPDVVIHTASIGSVDYCETHKEEARQTNVEGSRNIMASCRDNGAFLVFTSSNAVFDGKKPPYKEEDPPNPLDYYGMTKLETERDLASSGLGCSIVRLMTMYGWNHPMERQNPVTWVLEKLKNGQKLNIVSDIYNNHLFVEDAARSIWAIIEKRKEGIYNIGGAEVVSRYELACSTAEIFGLDTKLINPVDSSFFPSIAPRPRDTSYDINKIKKDLGISPVGIKEGLRLMKGNPPKEWNYARL